MSAALGRRLRDSGMQQVLAFEEDWKENYRSCCIVWFERLPKNTCFTGEALRAAARRYGVKEPHHFNCWSAGASGLIRTWLRAQMIQVVGLRAAESALTRAHMLREYRKV